MKKLLILTVCLILTVSLKSQTLSQQMCFNTAMQFISDSYSTIAYKSEEDNAMSILAYMPLGYDNYMIKVDMNNFVELYNRVELSYPWYYDYEMECIVCVLKIDNIEDMYIAYSQELNSLFFYFKWEK